MSLPVDGIYRILSAIDPGYCIDLTGAVATKGANVELWARNDTNAQKMEVKTSGGATNMRFACSDMRMDVKGGGTPANGQNVIQWPENSSGAQDFVLDEDTSNTMDVNGNTYSTFEIGYGNGFAVDAAYGKADYGTNVLIWEANDDVNQRWCFVKDSYLEKSLPVPASLGLATSSDDEGETELSINANTGFFAVWNCDATAYQMRYRKRSRAIGSNVWGDWGSWRNASDATTDEGWGDAWDKNVTTAAGRGHSAQLTISNPLTASTDKDEYQFELRAWGEDSNAPYWKKFHGASAVANVSVAYKPNLTINNVEFTPYGLFLNSYSLGSWTRSGNKLKVSNLTIDGDLLCEGYEWDELPSSGTVLIPIDKLLFVPAKNKTVKFDAEVTTIDCATQFAFSKTVTYTGPNCVFHIDQTPNGDDVDVSYQEPGISDKEIYIVYAHGGGLRCEKCDGNGTTWKVKPPFNVDYTIIASGRVTSPSLWGVIAFEGRKVASDHYAWDWGEHTAHLAVAADSTSMMGRSFTKNATAYKLNGLEYDSVAYGKADTNEISVNGYVRRSAAFAGSTLKDFELLLNEGYALFRDPYGGRYHVAVTKMSDGGYVKDWLQLSITQSERS